MVCHRSIFRVDEVNAYPTKAHSAAACLPDSPSRNLYTHDETITKTGNATET
jgi:hypothetical protein